LFVEMIVVYGLAPDEVTMVGFISAVRDIGLLGLGRSAHGYVLRRELSLDGALGVALINMYIRCGSMGAAHSCFSSVSNKNVEHWTSVIAGFAAHGPPEMALSLFGEMRQLGIEPNGVTFVAVLNACSHGGLVDEGFKHFSLMRSMGIKPTIQHYGCLVDLLGRAGCLDQARNTIETMPMEPTPELWGSLLAACRSHRCVELAELSVERLADLGADDSGVYVLLSNIYADEGMWNAVLRIRKLMSDEGMKKDIGRSVIEVDGEIHEFVNGGSSHICKDEIYLMLRNLSNMAASI